MLHKVMWVRQALNLLERSMGGNLLMIRRAGVDMRTTTSSLKNSPSHLEPASNPDHSWSKTTRWSARLTIASNSIRKKLNR